MSTANRVYQIRTKKASVCSRNLKSTQNPPENDRFRAKTKPPPLVQPPLTESRDTHTTGQDPGAKTPSGGGAERSEAPQPPASARRSGGAARRGRAGGARRDGGTGQQKRHNGRRGGAARPAATGAAAEWPTAAHTEEGPTPEGRSAAETRSTGPGGEAGPRALCGPTTEHPPEAQAQLPASKESRPEDRRQRAHKRVENPPVKAYAVFIGGEATKGRQLGGSADSNQDPCSVFAGPVYFAFALRPSDGPDQLFRCLLGNRFLQMTRLFANLNCAERIRPARGREPVGERPQVFTPVFFCHYWTAPPD